MSSRTCEGCCAPLHIERSFPGGDPAFMAARIAFMAQQMRPREFDDYAPIGGSRRSTGDDWMIEVLVIA